MSFKYKVAATATMALMWGLTFSVNATPVGLSQSPIDITGSITSFAALPAFNFSYSNSVTLDVLNTGSPNEERSIRANVNSGSRVTVGAGSYDLLQFHFHAPAEHLVNGVESAMELHLVHSDSGGNLLVIGRFIEACPGACTSPLDAVFAALPASDVAPHLALSGFDLNELLPADLGSFRYSGSLTTDPYTEPVAWNVLAAPLYMSQANIDAFALLFNGPDGNAREVQALNGRPILTDVVGFANAVPEPATYALTLMALAALGASTRRRGATQAG